MNYRRGWAVLEIEIDKWQSWSEMTVSGVQPNWHSAWGKDKAGLGHSYSYGYRLASGTWAKAKAGAQLQVSIWNMGQGQSWGTVTVSAWLASETWSKAKAGAQYSFSQVSFWDMAGQSWPGYSTVPVKFFRGPAANFVCPSSSIKYRISGVAT